MTETGQLLPYSLYVRLQFRVIVDAVLLAEDEPARRRIAPRPTVISCSSDIKATSFLPLTGLVAQAGNRVSSNNSSGRVYRTMVF